MSTRYSYVFFKVDVIARDGSLIGSRCEKRGIKLGLDYNSDQYDQVKEIFRDLSDTVLLYYEPYFKNKKVTFKVKGYPPLDNLEVRNYTDLCIILEALDTLNVESRNRTIVPLVAVADCESEAGTEATKSQNTKTDSNDCAQCVSKIAVSDSEGGPMASALSRIEHLEKAIDVLATEFSSISTILKPLSSAISRIETAAKKNATDLSAEVKSIEKTVKSMLPRFDKLMATLEKHHGPNPSGKKNTFHQPKLLSIKAIPEQKPEATPSSGKKSKKPSAAAEVNSKETTAVLVSNTTATTSRKKSKKKKNKAAEVPVQAPVQQVSLLVKKETDSLAESNEVKKEDTAVPELSKPEMLVEAETSPKELIQEVTHPSGASEEHPVVASSSSDPNEELDGIEDAGSDFLGSSFEVASETDFEEPQPADKVSRCLNLLLDMGYNNDGGWLSRLVEIKEGDVANVLKTLGAFNDVLLPRDDEDTESDQD